jgi:hypothetical protein
MENSLEILIYNLQMIAANLVQKGKISSKVFNLNITITFNKITLFLFFDAKLWMLNYQKLEKLVICNN